MIINCETDAELKHYRDKAMMLRCIALDDMDKPILLNMNKATKRDKVKIQLSIEKNWEMPDDEILKRFNEICVQGIFDSNFGAENLTIGYVGEPKEPTGEYLPQDIEAI